MTTPLYTLHFPFLTFVYTFSLGEGPDRRQERDCTPLHNGSCWRQWSLL